MNSSLILAACFLLAGLAILGVLTGCLGSRDTSSGLQDFQNEMMAADRGFARDVAAADPADRGRVWADWFASDGRQIVPGGVVTGTEAIAEMMGPFFATPGVSLTWDPDTASASAGGDMGWTSGRYESRSPGPEGETIQHGRYLTIWRRQADGTWKVDLDTGVPDPAHAEGS